GLNQETDYGRKAEGFKLKAEILYTLERPLTEIAEAYYEAGRRRYWNNEHQAAVELFKRANEFDNHSPTTYWYLADALLMTSYIPTPPYVDKGKIEESLRVWNVGAEISLPDTDFSWAFVSRAYINEQRTRLPKSDRWGLMWEAIVYLERALLLNEEIY